MHRVAGVRAVVFDFDGTLARLTIDFDSMRHEVLALLARQGGRAGGLERLAVLELVEAAAARLREGGLDAAAFRAAAMDAVERIELDAADAGGLFPGVPAALAALRARGYRLAIVTRNSAAAVARVLGRAGEPTRAHEVLLARDHVPRVKPDPAHLGAALAVLGLPAGAALMVGDHPLDVEAGRRVGMRTAGVLSGRHGRAAFEAAGADLVIEDVSWLPGVLPARAGRGADGEG